MTNQRGVQEMTSRNDVYASIDSERDYQDMRKKRDQGTEFHSVEEFLLYMEDYLHEARSVASRTWGPEAKPKILEVLRKVTALGVACLEIHGAPQRKGFERDREEPTRKIVVDMKLAFEQLSNNPELGAKLMELLLPEATVVLKAAEKEVVSSAEQIGELRHTLHCIAYEGDLCAEDMRKMAEYALYGTKYVLCGCAPFEVQPVAPTSVEHHPDSETYDVNTTPTRTYEGLDQPAYVPYRLVDAADDDLPIVPAPDFTPPDDEIPF